MWRSSPPDDAPTYRSLPCAREQQKKRPWTPAEQKYLDKMAKAPIIYKRNAEEEFYPSVGWEPVPWRLVMHLFVSTDELLFANPCISGDFSNVRNATYRAQIQVDPLGWTASTFHVRRVRAQKADRRQGAGQGDTLLPSAGATFAEVAVPSSLPLRSGSTSASTHDAGSSSAAPACCFLFSVLVSPRSVLRTSSQLPWVHTPVSPSGAVFFPPAPVSALAAFASRSTNGGA